MIMKGSKDFAKQSTNKCQKLLSKIIPVTQSGRFCQSLGNTFQSHRSTCSCIYLQITTFWIFFGNSIHRYPQPFLRNPLPTWGLADAHTSVLAGCFHFTLPNSCCPFFLAKARLVPVGVGDTFFRHCPMQFRGNFLKIPRMVFAWWLQRCTGSKFLLHCK